MAVVEIISGSISLVFITSSSAPLGFLKLFIYMNEVKKIGTSYFKKKSGHSIISRAISL